MYLEINNQLLFFFLPLFNQLSTVPAQGLSSVLFTNLNIMKNLFFALLLLVSQIGLAQMTYGELPDNHKEIYKIIHVYSDGLTLAYTEYPSTLFISKDLGESWEEIETNGHEVDRPSYIRTHLDSEGRKYISHLNEIFLLDEDLNELVPVLIWDDYDYVEDFNFLPNGNIVVAESRFIRLYNENFELIKEHTWWTHSAHILIGDNGKYLVTNSHGASYSILGFDDDLEFTEEMPIPSSRNFDLINGRIYGNSRFSDDYGDTWQYYPSENSIGSSLLAVDEDRMVVEDDSEFLISYDSGVSFEPIIIENPNSMRDLFLHENGGISIYSIVRESGEGVLRTTYDEGMTYNDIILNLGTEYALDVEVDDAGYAFVTYKTRIDANRFDPTLEVWSSFGDESCISSSSAQVKPLANSTILGNWGCISKDHGESWDRYGSSYIYVNEIIEKNEILYDVEHKLRKSSDFGVTWEEIDFAELEDYPEYIDVTGEGNLIVYSYDFNNPMTNLYFQDGTVEELDFHNGINYFFTAYTGPTVYIISQFFSDSFLFKSHNGYNDFTAITLPFLDISIRDITVDYLNNLYVQNGTSLFMSRDEGETWEDISPNHPDIREITDVELGYDLHLYISTIGTSILKSDEPVEEANHLEVIVFEDKNENCQFDEGEESLMDGFTVTVNDKYSKVSRTSASMNFNLLHSDNVMQINVDESLYHLCDFDSQVIFDQGVKDLVRYIPISIINECPELELNATIPLLRRCFENEYTFEVQNHGSIEAPGVVLKVELDEHFEFISSNRHVLSTNGQEVVLGLNDIGRNEKERVKVKFELSCDAELGQAHYMNASIITENSCSGIELTEAFECRENIGSYDPNDKTTLVNGVANIETIAEGSTIEYLIRFQNTGTDTAFIVRVEDAITSLFDRSSLQVVASSHDFEFSSDRGAASFLFENILLPDSTTNEKESHGFIKFRIDLGDHVRPGDILLNSADIYFDFNERISTNTTSNYYICKHQYVAIYDTICPGESSYGFTEEGFYYDEDAKSAFGCDSIWYLDLVVLDATDAACMTVAIEEIERNDISLYPNPTRGQVFFESPNQNVTTVNILDVQGRKLKTLTVDGNTADLGVRSGIYLLEMVSSNGWRDVQKIVVVE